MDRNTTPDPLFLRRGIQSLNGEWEFEIGAWEGKMNCPLKERIRVPFCPESELSGIAHTDFIEDCVYSRVIECGEEDLKGRYVLHFGAVDYIAVVYVNGRRVASHTGGFTPFEADIAPYVKVGENRITVCVHDDTREKIPSGKQSSLLNSYGCFYTRSTGIWQSVWLERTPKAYLRSVRFYPDIENSCVDVETVAEGEGVLDIRVTYQGKEMGRASAKATYRNRLRIPLAEVHLWELGKGGLYDVEIAFGGDFVTSYFGMRTAVYKDGKFYLNGRSVFQRLVLDQGYYPSGIYTAPSEEDLERDIRLALALGFNGARLHQKVFEPLFLYYCDKLGYMVWGEFPSWGVEYERLDDLGSFLGQWSEAVLRDLNHPSIVTWCPLNETWRNLNDPTKVRDRRFNEAVYALTKVLDETRPCVDASGGYHGRHTDLFDFHDYHEGEKFKQELQAIEERGKIEVDEVYAPDIGEDDLVYDGKMPLHVSEYGGVSYALHGNGWGYHACASEEEFVDRYVQQTELLLQCDKICGFCYTQLYDVEQEQNGAYAYDRSDKLSEKAKRRILECNRQIAAIEK